MYAESYLATYPKLIKIAYDMKNKILFQFLTKFWYAPADAFLRANEAIIWSKQKLTSPILDIGCGDGQTSKLILAKQKKIDVGVDLNPSGALKVGIYKKVVTADASRLPFTKNSFQTVISNSTFEHIRQDKKAVSEVARVLKSGGQLFLTIPDVNLNKFLTKKLKNKTKLNNFNQRVQHLHYRSEKQWYKILEKNNLKVVTSKKYLSKKAFYAWYKLFKLVTFKPYKRELWSYLKDSPYGKLFPKKIIVLILYLYLSPLLKNIWDDQGSWILIVAKKK